MEQKVHWREKTVSITNDAGETRQDLGLVLWTKIKWIRDLSIKVESEASGDSTRETLEAGGQGKHFRVRAPRAQEVNRNRRTDSSNENLSAQQRKQLTE